MQLYILDNAIRRAEVVESYESLIWTERWAQYGDFQLDISPNMADKILTTQGTMLAIDRSNRVMFVNEVENALTEEGKRVLRITGFSLEAKLLERPNDYTAIVSGAGATQVTLGPATPGDIMRTLFHAICRTNPAPFDSDNMPFIQAGVYSPATTIPEPDEVITVQSPLNNLYDTLKSIAEVSKLGFRIVRPADDSKLYFEVYTGNDRTTAQTVNSHVVFSPELDTLDNYKELTSTKAYRNVAYVYAPNGSRIVYGDNADTSTAGFEKHILIVDASDLDGPAGPTLDDQMAQRGREELAKANIVWGFDGEIPQASKYAYGTYYELGDLVEQRTSSGLINKMRVTEQIFSHDAEGERSYPTLTVDTLVLPGTWDAISPSVFWESYTTQHWDEI